MTTFQLTAGALTLSVQPTAALTNAAAGTTAIFGSLGVVAVTDNHGGIANWNVSGASAGFTGAGGSTSTAVSYTGGVVTTSGTIVVAPGTEKSMSATPTSVVAPTTLLGHTTASWRLTSAAAALFARTLAVTMPANALAAPTPAKSSRRSCS